ncbi:hypothetical protein [uncultured Pseudomonas sp.]|uniref:hypothetical protein n=1 Tax=uncultured Pseudomonas sp. TaxID=114707 RepID=UPI0025E37FDB|nr:hypothetical protein [uncultured Pseudomonas sp.]
MAMCQYVAILNGELWNMKGHTLVALITGVVVPVLLFLLSPYWGSMFADSKSLGYDVIQKRYISQLDDSDPVSSQIKLSFKGRDISKGVFVTLLLANTGKIPIKKEDFYSSIIIDTSGGNVLVSQLIDSYPEGMSLELSQAGSKTVIKPLLINSGDTFIIKLFSDNDIKIESVSARILGVSAIEKIQKADKKGFAIKSIKPSDREGATMERQVMPLPLYLVGFLSVVFLIAASYSFIEVLMPEGVVLQLISSVFSLSLFVAGLAGLKICGIYFIEEYGVNRWVNFAWYILLFFISGMVAYRIWRYKRSV